MHINFFFAEKNGRATIGSKPYFLVDVLVKKSRPFERPGILANHNNPMYVAKTNTFALVEEKIVRPTKSTDCA